MRLLLDTHVFLWALIEPQRLSPTARAAIRDPANDVFVSAAVAWEIGIKYALGKLSLPEEPETFVPFHVNRSGFRELPVSLAHGLAVASLPSIHADPFDRILIAQARVEGMTMISHDSIVLRYPIAFQR